MSIVTDVTPSICCLAALEYATKPRSSTKDDPDISLSVAATSPPVQDSAVARVSFLPLHSSNRATTARRNSSSAISLVPRAAELLPWHRLRCLRRDPCNRAFHWSSPLPQRVPH